jgi:hypothetical protein
VQRNLPTSELRRERAERNQERDPKRERNPRRDPRKERNRQENTLVLQPELSKRQRRDYN